MYLSCFETCFCAHNDTSKFFLRFTFKKQYLNGTALNELHPSLNNRSKLAYFIEKQRRLLYPHGGGLLAVVHEFMHNNQSKDPYIRSVRKYQFNLDVYLYAYPNSFFFFSAEILENQVVVICMRKEQSELLSQCRRIEIDGAYKRIHGDIVEWEMITFSERHHQGNIYIYIFFVLVSKFFAYHYTKC